MKTLNMNIESMKYVSFAVFQCWTLNCLLKKQHCFVSLAFWQIVMMWVVTWFKLAFKQRMFIMPKLCPRSSNSPQFKITDFWVAYFDWQSIKSVQIYGKGEWIIRIQANASSKSKSFPNKAIDRPLRKTIRQIYFICK